MKKKASGALILVKKLNDNHFRKFFDRDSGRVVSMREKIRPETVTNIIQPESLDLTPNFFEEKEPTNTRRKSILSFKSTRSNQQSSALKNMQKSKSDGNLKRKKLMIKNVSFVNMEIHVSKGKLLQKNYLKCHDKTHL